MNKIVGGALALGLLGLVAGCSGGGSDDPAAGQSPMAASLQGTVHGGQAPIVGAAITLYAASMVPVSSATVLGSASTDSQGGFSFGTVTCPSPQSQLYVTATGGNAGGGVNGAIHLMAILGQCQSLHRSVTVNELTTVAAAYTVNRFIGPAGCADCGGGLPTGVDNISGSAPGLPNALNNAATLANAITGEDGLTLPTAADCAASTPPVNCMTVRKLNTLGNAMAACVNSSGLGSSQCAQFFDCATPGAAVVDTNDCSLPAGAVNPSDTLQAILNVARNPASVSATGLDNTAARNVVFSPEFTTHNTEETLAVNFVGGGLDSPGGIAIDSKGNVWVANQGVAIGTFSVSKFNPTGVPLSPALGFRGGGLASFSDQYVAIDASDRVWVTNTGNVVIELDQSGNPLSGASGYSGGGLSNPIGIAIAPTGEVWVTDFGSNALTELSSTGAALSPTGGFTGGGLGGPEGVAIAPDGTIWVGNLTNNDASQFHPAGAALSGTSGITGGGLNKPVFVAMDPAGNAWFANYGNNSLSEINPSGTLLSPAAGFTGGGLALPFAIAVDAAGNVWVANGGAGTLSEFSGAGTPISGSPGFAGPPTTGLDGLAIDPSGNVWVTSAANPVTVYYGVAAPTRTPIVATLTQGFAP